MHFFSVAAPDMRLHDSNSEEAQRTLSFYADKPMLPLTVLMIPMYYMENAVGLVNTKLGLAIAHLAIGTAVGHMDGKRIL